jgi:D-alanyl-D-alanine carboxypeptidase
MSITLTGQDKFALRAAAYGAVSPMAAAGSPHEVATDDSITPTSATGPIGHVLAEKTSAAERSHLPLSGS